MSLIGIDIGSFTSKVACVNGRRVTIIANGVSERSTQSIVCYDSDRRYIGEDSATKLKMLAKRTVRNMRGVAGAIGDLSAVPHEYFYAMAVAGRDAANSPVVKMLGSEELLHPVQIIGAFLGHIVRSAEASCGPVAGAVLSVPHWFSAEARQAIRAACQVCGVSCLGIIEDSTAVLLNYGLRFANDFAPEGTVMGLFGMGHASTEICIAHCFAAGCQVLAAASLPDLGSRDFDYIVVDLIEAIGRKFPQAESIRTTKNLKRRILIEDTARRVKTILSATDETHFHIECFWQDEDLDGVITRTQFEEACAVALAPRLRETLTACLAQAGISPSTVEIWGGGPRVPWVAALIGQAFNCPVSRTLCADDVVAKGCALIAANLSASYRVKQYRVPQVLRTAVCAHLDGLVSGKKVTFVTKDSAAGVAPQSIVYDVEDAPLVVKLLEANASYPCSVTITAEWNPGNATIIVGNDNGNQLVDKTTFTFTAHHDATLAITITVDDLGHYRCTDCTSTLKKTVEETYTERLPTTDAAEPQLEPIEKKRSVCRSIISKITVQKRQETAISDPQVTEWTTVETETLKREATVKQLSNLRNLLETAIYNSRDRCETTWKRFITDAENQAVETLAGELTIWLHEVTDQATCEQYEERVQQFNNLVAPIEQRVMDEGERQDILLVTKPQLESMVAALGNLKDCSQKTTALKLVASIDQWIDTAVAANQAVPPTGPVPYPATAIHEHLKQMHQVAETIDELHAAETAKESATPGDASVDDTMTDATEEPINNGKNKVNVERENTASVVADTTMET